MKYIRLPLACSCSQTTLEQAALKIGPAFVYDLHVERRQLLYMRSRLKEMCADVRDHPLAPYINLIEDPDLHPEEWYLSANDISVGSEGV